MGLLDRLLARSVQRNGAAAALETIATGVTLPNLDPISPKSAANLAFLPGSPDGKAALDVAVLSKLLHGWLQNRHQTLFPLSVNLRTLDVSQRVTLAHLTAVCLLAEKGHARDDAARVREERARGWLAAAGADHATMDVFEAALAEPPSLSRLIDAVIEHGVAPYAYVAALISIDSREASGSSLLDYLAARLALPATLVRGADRRHRR